MIHTLRERALELFQIGVGAADPALAVRKALISDPIDLGAVAGTVNIVAIGKAACAMTQGAIDSIPDSKRGFAIVLTTYENERPVEGASVYGAGHPTPDQRGYLVTKEIQRKVSGLSADDFVLVLISGGGSALTPAPVAGLSLDDKKAVNDLMISGGLAIEQINLVRQNLSEFKGGGLARAIHPAQARTLILSDVIGDDLCAIASGPTASMLGKKEDARRILRSASLWEQLPTPVQQHLLKGEAVPSSVLRVTNRLIASNSRSLSAMLDAAGAKARICSDNLVGDVESAAARIVANILDPRFAGAQILLWGGETTVNLKGSGMGGRNQELALRVAQIMPRRGGEWVFVSAGTDGRDGPTDAAGGMVDAATLARLETAKISLSAYLNNNDSYSVLQQIEGLVKTGATGTNVADLQIFIRG